MDYEDIEKQILDEELEPEFNDDSIPSSSKQEQEPLSISDYVNLSPRLTDIEFQRSGELIDLKILKENIYLKSKRTYITGLLLGVIIFVLGVI